MGLGVIIQDPKQKERKYVGNLFVYFFKVQDRSHE